ncbi:Peroxisomal sarcosine oxidase-like [Oopsacas minuta]|uniref:sarcosine oxidasee (formaldehyde-forming) n=1 Tax=Oopsacas minuta TaxID=111878 RepID=A0AAV7JYF7_9METZ|nr:Peroxisomal sarcosine oxidase-like [Oopsacas minuta]
MTSSYDTIVVGAGIEGSATAMYLAIKGSRTLLLEQFELEHTRGSSHGGSRIIRYNYPESFYVEMMKKAYPLWSDIEKQAEVKLVEKCGGITFGHRDHVEIRNGIESLSRENIPYSVIESDEIQKRYPFLNLPDDFVVVAEPDSGYVYARKSLKAMQKIFVSNGGTILDMHKVVGITPGRIIRVKTLKGSFQCKSLIICAGPWTNTVLAYTELRLPITPHRVCISFYKQTHPVFDNIPIFIYRAQNDPVYYYFGMPDSEYPGLFKICAHDGVVSDPDDRDLDNQYSFLKYTSAFIASKLRGVSSKPSILETCMYSITPDYHPFLDRHPHFHNIVIEAGFSGHGFKLAPVVGSILSGLALHEEIDYDISHFKISRFKSNSKL